MKGLGVILNELGGNESSVSAIQKAIFKPKIKEVTFRDDALYFTMENGYRFKISDQGQSCCENRYMKCDEDLSQFGGAELLGAEVRDQPSGPAGYGEHEIAFLIVKTSKGNITANTHNEHNGYYGGFSIQASEI